MNTFSNIENQVEQIQSLEKKLNEKLDKHLKSFESRVNSNIKSILEKFDAINPSVVQPLFKLIASKYYYIEHEKQCNWFVAGDKCREMGGHLVSFQNQEEFDAVKTQLKSGVDYWIDFNDLGAEGEFVSMVTGLKPKFTNWHNGEPNGQRSEHCGDLWYYNNKHLMNDANCSYKKGFICELAKNN